MMNCKDIDSYIENQPAETQLRLRQLRAVIKKNAPAAQETIAYGIPTFRLNGNLVHFGGFKEHCQFFPDRFLRRRF